MKTTLTIRGVRLAAAMLVLSNCFSSASVLSKIKVTQDPQKTRADYVARMQQQTSPAASDATLGSLWVSGGALTNIQSDYKASRINDLVTIVVVQRTTAQATGNVGTQRDFNTSSGISGLAGHISTSGIDQSADRAIVHQAEGRGFDRRQHDHEYESCRTGDRGSAQRQPGG